MTNESNILVIQTNVMQSVMLCRYGHSRDKPFCDDAHVRSGFSDPAWLPAKIESEVSFALLNDRERSRLCKNTATL